MANTTPQKGAATVATPATATPKAAAATPTTPAKSATPAAHPFLGFNATSGWTDTTKNTSGATPGAAAGSQYWNSATNAWQNTPATQQQAQQTAILKSQQQPGQIQYASTQTTIPQVGTQPVTPTFQAYTAPQPQAAPTPAAGTAGTTGTPAGTTGATTPPAPPVILDAATKQGISNVTQPKAEAAMTTDQARAGAASLNTAIQAAKTPDVASVYDEVTQRWLNTSTPEGLAKWQQNFGITQQTPKQLVARDYSGLDPAQQSAMKTVYDAIDRMNKYNADPTTDPSYKLISDRNKELDSRLATQEQIIKSEADALYKERMQTNDKIMGQLRVFAAQMGTTGVSSSQMIALTSETIAANDKALLSIRQAEWKALNEAEMAHSDADFELAAKQIEIADARRKEYIDLATKQAELVSSFKTQNLNLKKLQSEMTKQNMEEMAKAGYSADDVPDSKAEEISMDLLGVADADLGRKLYQGALDDKATKDAKTEAETNQLWMNSLKTKMEIAKSIPEGEQMSFKIGDDTFTITGTMSEGENWDSNIVSTPAGQYKVFTSKDGKEMSRVRLGDNYVAPVRDPDTGEWSVYKPPGADGSPGTITPTLNPGTYNEGVEALGAAGSIVDSLVAGGGTITQSAGDGPTHKNLTGYDVAIPKGTNLTSPFKNAQVVAVGTFDQRITKGTLSMKDYGNYVDIMDVDTGARIRMAHMSKTNVKVGDTISKGDSLGLSGNTGLSLGKTGNHVHIEALNADGSHVTPNKTPLNAKPVDETTEKKAAPVSSGVVKEYENATGFVLEKRPDGSLLRKSDAKAVKEWKLEQGKASVEQAGKNQEIAFAQGKEFKSDPSYKAYKVVQIQEANVQSALKRMEENIAAGRSISSQDQAIIYSFNRILDPNSSVRQSEYARTAEGQALLDRIQAGLSKIEQGGSGSSPETLREVAVQTSLMVQNYKTEISAISTEMVQRAKIAKLDPRLIVGVDLCPPVKATNQAGQVFEVLPTDPEYLSAFLNGTF